MLFCDVILETVRGLIFLPALWPGASEEDVEMMPGMIEHAVFILGLFITDSTVIICFGHHFATDLALLLSIAYSGAEFFLSTKIGRHGERCRVQDSVFAGVQQTLSLQHLLLKFLHLSAGFLCGRGLQFCRVKHLSGPEQLGKHVE